MLANLRFEAVISATSGVAISAPSRAFHSAPNLRRRAMTNALDAPGKRARRRRTNAEPPSARRRGETALEQAESSAQSEGRLADPEAQQILCQAHPLGGLGRRTSGEIAFQAAD